MERQVFLMQVKPGQIEVYRQAHQSVWPEVLEACRRVGMQNYSIFMAGTHLIAYFESEDAALSLSQLQNEDALKRWWAYMDPVMAPEPEYAHDYQEVFHLD